MSPVRRRKCARPAFPGKVQHRYMVPDKFKNFPIYAWGFAIGPAITKLHAEWQAK